MEFLGTYRLSAHRSARLNVRFKHLAKEGAMKDSILYAVLFPRFCLSNFYGLPTNINYITRSFLGWSTNNATLYFAFLRHSKSLGLFAISKIFVLFPYICVLFVTLTVRIHGVVKIIQ